MARVTAEQFIGEYVSVYGHMPPREELWHGIEGLSQHGAAAALKAYEKAHPEARRAPPGAKRKLSKSDRLDAPKLAPRNEWQQTGESATIQCRESSTIRTLEDLLDAAQVDSELWQVSSHQLTKWDSIVKHGDDNAVVEMFRVHATLKRRSEVADLRRLQTETLAAIEAHAPAYSPIMRPPHTGGHLLMLSPSDAHLGKLAWSEETGQPDQTLDSAVEMVRRALRNLTARALPMGLDRIVLVIGNDFTQTDGNNDGKTTTRGTAVDTAERYWKVFNAGRDLLISEIEWLTQYAPVTVMAVPGNHDTQTALSMGQLLAAWFRNNEDVTVDAAPTFRKYLRYGRVLLGFTHGDREKVSSLPQLMSSERRQDWADALCCEWITGHYHHQQEKHFMPLLEEGGVLIRRLPSLSRQDAWHTAGGYQGQTAAVAIVYDKTGEAGSYKFRPEAM